MEIFILLIALILAVVFLRLFGAWMLRINEVIDLLQSINSKLSKTI